VSAADVKNVTIAAYWEAFRKTAVSADAPPLQLQETRRAFYAGFHGMQAANIKLAYMSEDAACAVLDSLLAEYVQFTAEVMAGRA
jgi:hypothetical protein